MYKVALFFTILILCFSCKDDVLPKPKGLLRLDYKPAIYHTIDEVCAYNFKKNEYATLAYKKKAKCWVKLEYPNMKGTIYLTYLPIQSNLDSLLRDTEKLTFDHTSRADAIEPKQFINAENNVYGMYYELAGGAATQAQFFVTDSTKHFLRGSLYFYSKSNYDSIYPAAKYLQKDIKTLMESITWK